MIKALDLAGDDWRMELRIGIAYNAAGLYARARAPLLSVVRQAPQNPLALYELGNAHQGLSEADLALGCFERAVAVRRDFGEAARALEAARKRQTGGRFFEILRRKL